MRILTWAVALALTTTAAFGQSAAPQVDAAIERLTKERDETRERLFAQLLGAMDRKDS